MSPTREGVVVANPGGVSWMIQSAATLAAHGQLGAYYAPAAFSEVELTAIGRRLPRPIADFVLSQLRLRAVPAVVPADKIVRAATPSEIAYVMSARMGLSERLVSAVVHRRMVAFDHAVSRELNSGVEAVIGYQGTAARTFRDAGRRGIGRILDYPVAHHRHCQELLQEEVKRVPAYAGTIQGDKFENWRLRRYDEEIALADRIIMVSSYHQRTFEEAGVDPSRMFMAHFGVDLDRFSVGPPRDETRFRVLFCGQITQRKGISYLVEAFKQAELADAELVFAGRPVGSRHPWIDEPRVVHIGAMARPQLVDVYRSADVIVLPSLIEGFPSTPLEGMACGVPAIVSEHTFGHDVIEDGVDGWVTPIRDAGAIAQRLRQLYEDRNLQRRMGAAARRKAERFTWAQYGAALREGIASLGEARAS